MRTDSAARICSKIASRSATSTGRSATCDVRTILLVLAAVVRRGVNLLQRCSSGPHLLADLLGDLAPGEGLSRTRLRPRAVPPRDARARGANHSADALCVGQRLAHLREPERVP